MARARNIKPGLFENELLGNADPLLTILFTALWCLADKAGRLEDRPEKIDSFAFRYQKNDYRKDVKTNELLHELQRMNFIIRYKSGEESLIQVNNFKKHQRPHHTEKESVLPQYDSNCLILKELEISTEEYPLNTGRLTVVKRSDSLIPDSLIPDSLIPDSRSKTYATPARKADLDFEKFWQIYPKRPGANKTQAAKAWEARLKKGASVEEMLRGAARYRQYCQTMQVEPQFIKQASTFIGPDEHYLNDWHATGKRHASQDFANRLTGRNGGDDGYTIDAE